MDIKSKEPIELMNIYAETLRALNGQGVVRTYNSPVGDYAEWLVANKLDLTLEHNSQIGYDAIDPHTNTRYQIKSRWERDEATVRSRTLNVIRNYDDNQFDYLIIVIFDVNFCVKEAYMLPHDRIRNYAIDSTHQNGLILIAKGPVLADNETQNITEKLN